MFENLNIKSEGGILLQFIFDQNLFNKVVYACYPYGIQAEGSSDKVKNILDVQKLSDKELRSLQFRMILTEDCLLNPQAPEVQKGFKAIADCQNPAALYDFKQEANEEFEKLKEEIEQDKKNALKKKREQRTRTWGEYFRSFFARGDRGS